MGGACIAIVALFYIDEYCQSRDCVTAFPGAKVRSGRAREWVATANEEEAT
jgi:hypothetical protein